MELVETDLSSQDRQMAELRDGSQGLSAAAAAADSRVASLEGEVSSMRAELSSLRAPLSRGAPQQYVCQQDCAPEVSADGSGLVLRARGQEATSPSRVLKSADDEAAPLPALS